MNDVLARHRPLTRPSADLSPEGRGGKGRRPPEGGTPTLRKSFVGRPPPCYLVRSPPRESLMIWTQNYDPLGSPWLSTFVAALPILILLGLLATGRVSAHLAALAGLL